MADSLNSFRTNFWNCNKNRSYCKSKCHLAIKIKFVLRLQEYHNFIKEKKCGENISPWNQRDVGYKIFPTFVLGISHPIENPMATNRGPWGYHSSPTAARNLLRVQICVCKCLIESSHFSFRFQYCRRVDFTSTSRNKKFFGHMAILEVIVWKSEKE